MITAVRRPIQQIKLKPHQFEVFKCGINGTRDYRYRALNAGRRFGKTYLACVEMFVFASNNRNTNTWYVAPTYRQAKMIAWDLLKSIIPAAYILSKNESDLSITLINYSMIVLKGSDNPDSLRGPGIDFLVMDEAAFQKEYVWKKVLRASIATQRGPVLFITTPSGFNWFYDLYMSFKLGNSRGKVFTFTSLEGGNIPAEEIEEIKGEVDERTFKQEMLASFEALSGRVYYAFDREKNLVPFDGLMDNETVHVGLDFNVNPMSAVFAVKRSVLHIFKSHLIPNGNTQLMADTIKQMFPNRRIVAHPDPTGNRRQTNAPLNNTDFTILRSAGFTVSAPNAPYAITDKFNTTNAAFKSASGAIKAVIDPHGCFDYIKGLDGLTFKEGTSDVDKSGGLDHVTDAGAYLICDLLPLVTRDGHVKVGAS